MNADSKEPAFQQDIIDAMVGGGSKLGELSESPVTWLRISLVDRQLTSHRSRCLQNISGRPHEYDEISTS